MYAQEYDNKVKIQCNAPSMSNLMQFWTEVQEYMDKGYRFDKTKTTAMMEVPAAMTFTRVTLIKEAEKENIKPTPTTATVSDSKPQSATKKAPVKKPAAKK